MKLPKHAGPPYYGPERVRAVKEKVGHRPWHRRTTLYGPETDDEWSAWRDWLAVQLALLPEGKAAPLANLLADESEYRPRITELAAGQALRTTGLRSVYDEEWERSGGKRVTPDWTCRYPDGSAALVLDAACLMPHDGELEAQRLWTQLAEAIAREIPHPVLLAPLRVAGAPPPPADEGTAKSIAGELHRQVSSPLHRGPEFTAGGHRFLLLDHGGDGRWGGDVRAHLKIPRPCAGPVDNSRLPGITDAKVSSYKDIAAKVPFVVAVAAHPWTGVSFGHLGGLLSGAPSLVVNLDVTDFYADAPRHEPRERAPWRPSALLSGVLWIDNAAPFPAT